MHYFVLLAARIQCSDFDFLCFTGEFVNKLIVGNNFCNKVYSMEISIKWTICRICLKDERAEDSNKVDSAGLNMRSIFLDTKLAQDIYDCSGVKVSADDSLPEKICQKCLVLLRTAVRFRTTCRNSDKQLQSVVETTKSATSVFRQLDKKRNDAAEIIEEAIQEILVENEDETVIPDFAECMKIGRECVEPFSVLETKSPETYEEEADDDDESQYIEEEVEMELQKEHEEECIEEEVEHLHFETDFEEETLLKCIPDEEEDTNSTPKGILGEESNERIYYAVDTSTIKEEEFGYEENDCEGKAEDGASDQMILEIDDMALRKQNDSDKVEYLVEEHLIPDNENEVNSTSEDSSRPGAVSTSHYQSANTAIMVKTKTFICHICGNIFQCRSLLNCHMRNHRNERKYECELCAKRFNNSGNLSAHMRTHTGEKPYECQFCGRRFSDRSTHIKHERVHTNEKPFRCFECGKSFSLSTTLRAHEKIHTGEKPYRCEDCDKSFKLAHQLKAHYKTHLHKTYSLKLAN